jgi:hypothetical protein
MFRLSSLLAPLLLSSAALSATAPIEVSLTVKESCLVEQRDARAFQVPAVSCALDSPYLVRGTSVERIGARDKAPPRIAAPPSAAWEVMF